MTANVHGNRHPALDVPLPRVERVNEYQQAVLDFVRHGSGHGVVEATAGSGKTTTLVMVARLLVDELMEEDRRAAFLAFNRSTADELRARLPPRVEAVTLHSLGRQVLARARPSGVELEDAKYLRLAKELLAGRQLGESGGGAGSHDRLAAYLANLFGFARLELTELADQDALASVRRRYAIEPPLPEGELPGLDALVPLLAEVGEQTESVDYTDMIYLTLRLRLEVPRFAFICVDEAQDLSRMALGLVQRLIGAGARALFVGDPHQAIYAFAGADARSLKRIGEVTAATRLPLSVSFRCPTRHVVLARRFSPDMRPAPGAATGEVRLVARERLPKLVRPGDLVMARTNAPLPELAIRLAGTGSAVRILGHDLVEDATKLAATLLSTPPRERAEQLVEASADAERRRIEREHLTSDELPGELERSGHAHAVLLLALQQLRRAGRQPTPESVGEEVERRFAPAGEHVLLSTVHKAKGREAERTFLLLPETLGVGASGPEAGDDAAEANVLFVALTRAKRLLVLVEAEPGAVAKRLAHSAPGGQGDLTSRWNDVLRLATVMSESAEGHGISSGHGTTRRVQDRRGQAGSGRRRARGRRDRQREDHR